MVWGGVTGNDSSASIPTCECLQKDAELTSYADPTVDIASLTRINNAVSLLQACLREM